MQGKFTFKQLIIWEEKKPKYPMYELGYKAVGRLLPNYDLKIPNNKL